MNLYTKIKYASIILIIIACESKPVHIHQKSCIHWRVSYYSNGQVRDSFAYNFDSTIRNGIEKVFNDNGVIGRISYFENNKREGKTIMYDSNGIIDQIKFYNNDVFSNYSIYFYNNGKIKQIDSIYRWDIIGKSWIFDSCGNVIQKGIVRNNKIFNIQLNEISIFH